EVGLEAAWVVAGLVAAGVADAARAGRWPGSKRWARPRVRRAKRTEQVRVRTGGIYRGRADVGKRRGSQAPAPGSVAGGVARKGSSAPSWAARLRRAALSWATSASRAATRWARAGWGAVALEMGESGSADSSPESASPCSSPAASGWR